MRRIFPENIANMRDIGGIFSKTGDEINLWKIIRSNYPIGITSNNITFLLEKGLTTIIDVRTSEDVQNRPNPLNQKNFMYYHIEMKGAGYPKLEEDIPPGYLEIIDDIPTIKKIFDIIGSAEAGVIINCNAGKDRTGIIALLLLLLANAYEEDIIVDYQLSYTYLKPAVIEMHSNNPGLPVWLGNSKAEYMEQTLKLFKKKYGDINAYFDHLGLGNEMKNIIYNKLVK